MSDSLEEKFEQQLDKVATLLETMTDEVKRLKQQREAYARAINHIDDFFEYRSESENDRKQVYSILDNLRMNLATIK